MPESDYLEVAMHKQWCNFLKIYKLFEKKRPIMLFDIQEEPLTEQYEEAVKENKLVVFVDNDQKRLVSFSMPLA